MTALLKPIKDRTARVGVIGQGYVGLPRALVYAEAGLLVTGFDLDPDPATSSWPTLRDARSRATSTSPPTTWMIFMSSVFSGGSRSARA